MASPQTLLAAFRSIPLLHELTDEQLQTIAQGTELWKKPGDTRFEVRLPLTQS